MLKTNKNNGWTIDKNHHTIDTFVKAVIEMSNVLKILNLKDQIQTSIRVKERQLTNYPKGKTSPLLPNIKEEHQGS